MPLERQIIEKKDFPIGRRGYDPEAVDAHLASLADEVDKLKNSNRRRSETLAAAASDQVRAIVEAAETSAAAITRQAEDEASDIRAEASSEAASARAQASSQAREYVGQVSESTAVMLQRLDAMESELTALVESLRTGSHRLNADLQLLENNLDDVKASVTPRRRFEPEAAAPATPAPAAAPRRAAPSRRRPEPEPEPEIEEIDDAELIEPEPISPEPEPEPIAATPVEDDEPAYSADDEDEVEAARLVALNMALNGTERDETDRYLEENYSLSDRAALLDEVYASLG